ncbi:uncharacterized protein HGUI_01815 [Hanseniaspora guilliermondii]|uniref:Uncharacterized protein n=1 Tax=Hanseniaspora guilliermondii TaxID=56406 RepID=A0A1L0CXP8_9ASCO|nr:uncharacterized protein HGUI_01815 [Hanseniaspora guilliermondii]
MNNYLHTPQKNLYGDNGHEHSNYINTPPSSVTKKLFNSFKNKRHSTHSFFLKKPKKNTNADNDKSPKKKLPTPLNLVKPEKTSQLYETNIVNKKLNFGLHTLDNDIQDFETNQSFLLDKSILSSNNNVTLMSAVDTFADKSSSITSSKHNSKKKYNDEKCIICEESLKMFLKGEKPVEIDGQGLAHYECYLMKDELQSSNLSNIQGPDESNIILAGDLSFKQPQVITTPFNASNSFTEKTELPCHSQGSLLTPVNQIVPTKDISENGFQKEAIKTTHQKMKKYSTIDINADFDVCILPQFYKVDLDLNSKSPLTISHVLKLNNKRDYTTLKDNRNLKTSDLNESLEKSLIKDMSDQFIRLFPEVFEDYDLNKILINMIDFVEMSFSDDNYIHFIIILDSAMDKVFLMSLDGEYSTVLKFDSFYKVIRLEESILVYSTSLDSPEISIRQPQSANDFSGIMDMGFSLDKWFHILKWRIAHKTIQVHVSSFATNLFEAIEYSDCCLSLHSYIDYVVETLPSDIMSKIVGIANQQYLDLSFIMPTLINSKSNWAKPSSSKLLSNDNEQPSYVCIAISTSTDISTLITELVKTYNDDTKLAFIRAQPDGSFSYIGFVDKNWDGLSEMEFCEEIQKHVLDFDNMFMKLHNLFTMNAIEKNDFVELKLFNDQPIENLGKCFQKLMKEYTGINIYNYQIIENVEDNSVSDNLEEYMEQTYQFTNNYSSFKLPSKDLDDDYIKNMVFYQNTYKKFVNLEIKINPIFESCVEFKNLENLYGQKVLIENSESIKSINLKLRNEPNCKLLLLDLEIINKKQFADMLSSIDKKNSLIMNDDVFFLLFKVDNHVEYYSSNSVSFDIRNIEDINSRFAGTPELSPVAKRLILDSEAEKDYEDTESDDSSTIDLFITTPITTNKEPLYLLREIELQLISIVDSIFFSSNKKMEKSERIDIINYYYTIFFSYSKNIDIKNSNVNFGYESISEYIDIVFEILLSNDKFKIEMLYEMMRYQYRGYIGQIA